MTDNKLKLKRIKSLEIATIVFDILAFIFFIVVMVGIMTAYELPIGTVRPGEIGPPHYVDTGSYSIFGIVTISVGYMNMFMTLAVMFASVTIAVIVITIKRMINKEDEDYNKWETFNTLMYAILSLLSFNIISAVLRLITGNNVLKYAEGVGYIGFIKRKRAIKAEFKITNAGKAEAVKERIAFNTAKEAELKANIKLYKKEAMLQKIEFNEHELLLKTNIELKEWNERVLDELDEEIVMAKEEKSQVFGFIFKKTLTFLFLGVMALFIFVPFYWMVITALRPYADIDSQVITFLPSLKNMQWVNFKYVFLEENILKYILNTLFVGIMSTAGTIVTTILAAFAFSRLDFKGRDGIFSLLLATMMVPGELFIMTNIMTVSRGGFGWVGGENPQFFVALIVPFMTSVFYTFYLRQTFKQIPNSLYQAAKVDGSSDFKYLVRVMIPMASSTIVTIIILSVIGSWNAFVWPRQVVGLGGDAGKNYYLVSVALRNLSFTPPATSQTPMYNLQLAASALVTVPLLIVFLAFRDRIMAGVGRSGIKG